MFVSVGGRRMYLWRAGDGEGEVLGALLQSNRGKAASRLLRRPPRERGRAPRALVADRLGSCAAAARELGPAAVHVRGVSSENRAEGSHVPIRLRGRETRGFQGPGSIQRFLAVHAAVADSFTSRHLMPVSSHRALRGEAFAAWRRAARAAA